MLDRFRGVVVVVFLMIVALVAISAGHSGSTSAQDSGPQATIEAQGTEIAQLKSTIAARGKKINAQRTQIADLKTQLATELTPVLGQGQDFEISGGASVSDSFRLDEGNHKVDTECTGTAFSVFLTIEDAPGSENVIFESLALGEDVPYSGTTLINVYQTGDAVLVLDVIDGNVTCTISIGE